MPVRTFGGGLLLTVVRSISVGQLTKMLSKVVLLQPIDLLAFGKATFP